MNAGSLCCSPSPAGKGLKSGIATFCMLIAVLNAMPAQAGYEEALAAFKIGDYATVLRELRPLADKGDAHAQSNLALLYENGWGVAQDNAKALTWYRRAASTGLADAQFGLARMYESGSAGIQDFAQAFALYQKAAEQGYANAQNNLGRMYLTGRGVAQDNEVALSWFQKAAAQGDAHAEFNLGLMFQDGAGIGVDRGKAWAWYSKAADQGVEEAKAKLRELAPSMPCGFPGAPCMHETVSSELQTRQAPTQATQPRTEAGLAQGVGIVPGAIVCADLRTVDFMYSLYKSHWSDAMQDAVTNGQSKLIRGESTAVPDPKRYGCTLLPPGTHLTVEIGNMVPVVTARLADGKVVRGVTYPQMIQR
jgi:hypothetical protein